jgi:hypothetical protein
MGNLLYAFAVILLTLWAIGFIFYAIGWVIHLLLIVAVVAIAYRIVKGRKCL